MPVLRSSLEAGTFEDTFFATPAEGEPDKLLRMCLKAVDAAKKLRRQVRSEARGTTVKERLLLAVTPSVARVYQEICMLWRLCKHGRVYPSYDHLQEATGLGRSTIAKAIRALEAAGFLVKQRRFQRVEAEGPGPRYEQTSNVYRPVLPSEIMSLLPRWLRPPPLPADEVQREDDRRDDHTAMIARLSCAERARALVQNGPLSRALALVGAHFDRRERESENDPETLLQSQ